MQRHEVAAWRRFRDRVFAQSRLQGEANVLTMPNIATAHIAYELIGVLGDALPAG